MASTLQGVVMHVNGSPDVKIGQRTPHAHASREAPVGRATPFVREGVTISRTINVGPWIHPAFGGGDSPIRLTPLLEFVR
jgi:hypothetical protein